MRRVYSIVATLLAIVCVLDRASVALGQSPADPTFFSKAYGVQLDGVQCVPAARGLAQVFLGKSFPFLGANGYAAQLWTINLSNWRKVPNDGRNLPTWFCLAVFNGKVANGLGHVGLVVGVKDRARRIIWLLDANWFAGRGALHSVPLDDRVSGWLE
jgi:hypothetical protein